MVTKQAGSKVKADNRPTLDEMRLVRDFIGHLESLGHIFLYLDGLGAIHLVPTDWYTAPDEESFLDRHADAINIFLAEREVQV